ncbi:MAG TPA: alpha-L-arabinofuranosidase C-terminal domain-containing protein [Chthonomonadaceae bacterium]|nr:alpha-L-arabinofuranosidase C-terminal domain-containing protein [Chthonomonadaceae bacterium]
MTSIRVTNEPLCSGEINPYQYGQFIEYLCNLVPGMWAEKLYDGSFEGLSPYNFVYLKETDFKEKPWYPSGATNRAEYTLDHDTKVSGEVSQKIATEGDSPCTVGISQDGIAVQKGTACAFSIYLRAEGRNAPVQVSVHHEGKVLATCAFQPTGDWQKYRAQLVPTDTDTNATLSISFRGPATLWLDNASLMPEDTVGGWRRDVVEALRALKPGIIRFGGSDVEAFEWRDTIGDPDHRKPFRAWGGLQPTGPGLEEIVQLIRDVDAEPLICVRVTGRTPQDAADEVQYFNGASDTPMGALRARNGHPEPYHIRYWQVGNELGGAEYAARLADFCRAMKDADPSIRLLSSYPSEDVLRNAGALLDYICPHHYECDDLKGKEEDFQKLQRMIREFAPGRHIKIGVTEWNTTGGNAGPRRAMLWTLSNALACSRYHNLLHRHADMVEIANRSNLTNSFCSGIIQTDNARLYKTPTYYAQELYATLAGNLPLRIEPVSTPDRMPDVSATLTPSGDAVVLFVVNDTQKDIVTSLDLSAFGESGREVAVWTLADREHAEEPDVTNSFTDPGRIIPVHSTFQAPASRFDYRFPALSLTVLRCPVRR